MVLNTVMYASWPYLRLRNTKIEIRRRIETPGTKWDTMRHWTKDLDLVYMLCIRLILVVNKSRIRSDALTDWATGALALEHRIDGKSIFKRPRFKSWLDLNVFLCHHLCIYNSANKTPFNNFWSFTLFSCYVCYTTNAQTTLIGLHKGNRNEHAVMFMLLIHPKMLFLSANHPL